MTTPGDDQEPFVELTPAEQEMERMIEVVQSWVDPDPDKKGKS